MSMTTTSSSTPAMDVFWDNVKTILYALALAMVLRFTIAQPFRIPSGSMQPTLFGVHFEDLRGRTDVRVPGPVGRFFSGVFQGRFYHHLVAEADGEVLRIEAPKSTAFVNHQDIVVRYAEGGRSWEKRHRLWFSPVDGHGGDLRALRGVLGWEQTFHPLLPGQPFKKGEVLISLKDSAGDHLFVDRLTYNFRPPRRGEIIVFETRNRQDQISVQVILWNRPVHSLGKRLIVAIFIEHVLVVRKRMMVKILVILVPFG